MEEIYDSSNKMEKELKNIRENIDEVDVQIMALLARRISLSKLAGEYKKKYNGKILDSDRIKEVLKEKEKLAEELNLDVDLVNGIFKKIIENSMEVQKKIKNEVRD